MSLLIETYFTIIAKLIFDSQKIVIFGKYDAYVEVRQTYLTSDLIFDVFENQSFLFRTHFDCDFVRINYILKIK